MTQIPHAENKTQKYNMKNMTQKHNTKYITQKYSMKNITQKYNTENITQKYNMEIQHVNYFYNTHTTRRGLYNTGNIKHHETSIQPGKIQHEK